MWKDFFYYTRSERRGIVLLIVLILLCLGGSLLIKPTKSTPKQDALFNRDYDAFVQSLKILNQKEYNKYFHPYKRQEIILAPFDPNTADSVTFLHLGLPPWMAKNILKYRAKGGKFKKPEDFKKIYGLTSEQYATLLPYITIAESKRDTIRVLAQRDTTKHYPEKYIAGTRIELNTADTTDLKRIPGIGSGIAKMIVRYRQQLGGFFSVSQLDEIHLLSTAINKWFTVNPSLIRKISLNKSGISRLNAHPYINFYQAKVILEHRRRHGNITSLKQLSLYEEFTQRDFERLSPYISFD